MIGVCCVLGRETEAWRGHPGCEEAVLRCDCEDASLVPEVFCYSRSSGNTPIYLTCPSWALLVKAPKGEISPTNLALWPQKSSEDLIIKYLWLQW